MYIYSTKEAIAEHARRVPKSRIDIEILVNSCHIAHFEIYISANKNNEMFKNCYQNGGSH